MKSDNWLFTLNYCVEKVPNKASSSSVDKRDTCNVKTVLWDSDFTDANQIQ